MFVSRAHILEVFFTKLIFNLKSEASKTYLSYAWWLLEPALMVAIYYVVFAIFLAKGSPDFVVFLVCGTIPFLWLDKSVTNSTGSISAGYGLINQASVPKPFFPMLVVFQDAIKQSVVFLFMFAFVAAYGMEVSWIWLSVLAVIITQFLLICALSLLVAAVTPFLPDFRYLVATVMTALMFGSGVFYSYTDVLMPGHQRFFLYNPVANLIKNYRQILMENTLPDWSALVTIGLFSIALILIMNRYYKKTDTIYARLITQ